MESTSDESDVRQCLPCFLDWPWRPPFVQFAVFSTLNFEGGFQAMPQCSIRTPQPIKGMLRRAKPRLFLASRARNRPTTGPRNHDSRGSVQPANERFHRWPSLLKRVTERGAMAMRQKDCGGAPIGYAMAAGMTAECVTAIDLPGYVCSMRSQSAIRCIRLRTDSPPCGAVAGSRNHAAATFGSHA